MPWRAVAGELWAQLNAPNIPYHWPIHTDALAALERLMPGAIGRLTPELAKQGGGSALRSAISRQLRQGQAADASHNMHCWVVMEWGQISTAPPPQWVEDLHPYDDDALRRFVDRSFDRIAAWSKILAFVDHNHFAIYDSRTSVALNVCLRSIGERRRFRMAPAREGTKADRAHRKMRAADPQRRATEGYASYLDLLSAFVSEGCAPDLLSAEQVIFSNAPSLANSFLDR
jgi:hypothetical protein